MRYAQEVKTERVYCQCSAELTTVRTHVSSKKLVKVVKVKMVIFDFGNAVICSL